jgi:hypothetical protein
MGGTPSVDASEFRSLKNQVNSQTTRINTLENLKKIVDNLSSAAASGIEYPKLAEAINKETTFRENLAKSIAQNPISLGQNVATEIGKSESVLESIRNNLASSTTLQDKIADVMSSNNIYRERIRGPKGNDGNIGDQGALKSNLFDKGNTLWCADGELCKLPLNKKGIQTSSGKTIVQIDDEWGGLSIQNPEGNWSHFGHKPTHPGTTNWIRGNTQVDGTFTANGGNTLMDNLEGGRVYAKNRVQIGDWIIYQRGDGHLGFWKGADRFIMDKDYPSGVVVNTGKDYSIRNTAPANDPNWKYLTRHGHWVGNDGKAANFHERRGDTEKFRFEAF